ncbi:hypothetical protein [Micromonospora okii]|uniref:hypothetical protein n=1 Tax=Micromonospora okii TaxID=1182970 RepID=UPI001E3B9E6D|nr:hypothetical protein [Micromonospora okii]
MSVAATNALTARWASTLDDGQTALSGAAAYPLLALLARYAAGPARAELLAVAAEPARYGLDDSPAARLALACWTHRGVELSARWRREAPPAMRGELTGRPEADQPTLDAWAAERTDGRIRHLPITVAPGTALVLAAALSVSTRWEQPFTPVRCRPASGPWRGRDLAGLFRSGPDLGALRVADTGAGPLTLLTVTGRDDVDVLLALGPAGVPAAAVLPAAIGALGDPGTLPPHAGPGVSEQVVDGVDDRPELRVATVAFTVDARHDLLARPALFGLEAATDPAGDPFPEVSRRLVVSQAAQGVTATFGATGFRAAAVTALGVRAGAARPRPTTRRRVVRLDVDRPFGFLAVHRRSGLVLAAGWVTDPDEATGHR